MWATLPRCWCTCFMSLHQLNAVSSSYDLTAEDKNMSVSKWNQRRICTEWTHKLEEMELGRKEVRDGEREERLRPHSWWFIDRRKHLLLFSQNYSYEERKFATLYYSGFFNHSILPLDSEKITHTATFKAWSGREIMIEEYVPHNSIYSQRVQIGLLVWL